MRSFQQAPEPAESHRCRAARHATQRILLHDIALRAKIRQGRKLAVVLSFDDGDWLPVHLSRGRAEAKGD